jgi:hypothetical protein
MALAQLGRSKSRDSWVMNDRRRGYCCRLGRSPKFGREKPIKFFNLLQPGSVLPHHQYRHRFGVGHHSPTPKENPLRFFSLLVESTTHHPTHNRGGVSLGSCGAKIS